MNQEGAACRQVARESGIALALRELYRDGVPHGPGGHAIVPGAGDDDPLLAAEGLTALRPAAPGNGGPEMGSAAMGSAAMGSAAMGNPEVALGLAWLRLGLSERLLDACLTYLGGRTVGADSLLDQQLVQADLADAGTDHAELLAVLTAGTTLEPAHLHRLHRQITAVDRSLLRLLGASGYLLDGPGRQAAVSELLADVYVELP
jgi:hypothetical protein